MLKMIIQVKLTAVRLAEWEPQVEGVEG